MTVLRVLFNTNDPEFDELHALNRVFVTDRRNGVGRCPQTSGLRKEIEKLRDVRTHGIQVLIADTAHCEASHTYHF